MSAALPAILRRPVVPDDRELLFRIYASTRTEELAIVPWSVEEKERFLRQQFDAQSTDWGRNYKGAEWSVIEVEGHPAGRLYVQRGPKDIRLIDIALLPEFRSRGIGTRLLNDLFAESRERQVPLTIHVETFNPARSLYERLGFQAKAEHGMYLLMEWRPESAGVAAEAS